MNSARSFLSLIALLCVISGCVGTYKSHMEMYDFLKTVAEYHDVRTYGEMVDASVQSGRLTEGQAVDLIRYRESLYTLNGREESNVAQEGAYERSGNQDAANALLGHLTSNQRNAVPDSGKLNQEQQNTLQNFVAAFNTKQTQPGVVEPEHRAEEESTQQQAQFLAAKSAVAESEPQTRSQQTHSSNSMTAEAHPLDNAQEPPVAVAGAWLQTRQGKIDNCLSSIDRAAEDFKELEELTVDPVCSNITWLGDDSMNDQPDGYPISEVFDALSGKRNSYNIRSFGKKILQCSEDLKRDFRYTTQDAFLSNSTGGTDNWVRTTECWKHTPEAMQNFVDTYELYKNEFYRISSMIDEVATSAIDRANARDAAEARAQHLRSQQSFARFKNDLKASSIRISNELRKSTQRTQQNMDSMSAKQPASAPQSPSSSQANSSTGPSADQNSSSPSSLPQGKQNPLRCENWCGLDNCGVEGCQGCGFYGCKGKWSGQNF